MWYECAYEWRIFSYAMHIHAILNAHAAEKVLFYVPSVDKPAIGLSKIEFDEMRAEPNIGTSAKFPGILPLYVGMEVILTESLLPPRFVRGTAATVVGIEVHDREPARPARTRIHFFSRLCGFAIHAEVCVRPSATCH